MLDTMKKYWKWVAAGVVSLILLVVGRLFTIKDTVLRPVSKGVDAELEKEKADVKKEKIDVEAEAARNKATDQHDADVKGVVTEIEKSTPPLTDLEKVRQALVDVQPTIHKPRT